MRGWRKEEMKRQDLLVDLNQPVAEEEGEGRGDGERSR